MKLKSDTQKLETGFTLVELLIVTAIVFVLASIAAAQLSIYRQNAFDAAARRDLRNAAHAEELYYTENEEYLTCSDENCLESNGGLPGLRGFSPGVSISMTAHSEDEGTPWFEGTATTTGSSNISSWDSSKGGLQ